MGMGEIDRFLEGISLGRCSCLNYLHRLGFAFKRPKRRLLKADAEKREAFVAEYAVLVEEAQETGAKIFFADEAHFRADAELRGKWVLRGAGLGGLDQPSLWGEGQLLFGGVPGDRRCGVDGTARQRQRRDLGCLPEATVGKAPRTAERRLGQCAGSSWRGGKGVPEDARPWAKRVWDKFPLPPGEG